MREIIHLVDSGYDKYSAVANPSETATETPAFTLQVLTPQWARERGMAHELKTDQEFKIRLEFAIDLPEGSIEVAVVNHYSFPDAPGAGFIVTPEWVRKYFNEVAVADFIAPLRIGVADLAMKVLDAKILMPALRVGDLVFDPSD
ncbi:hypothetical protein M5J20_11055 [Corynebacterium sp. TA-R-1]|uniref:Uncharacterized protein n=1 Tax=Corynebacterium stercoris TaxID=2943490 RepID=A0ABT1G6Q3_9CORY|nr:hypothetical protein [Corynebacterium stercoris]MCP1388713.1 hypothetical protein [Corynebacterium stercoris]